MAFHHRITESPRARRHAGTMGLRLAFAVMVFGGAGMAPAATHAAAPQAPTAPHTAHRR